MTNEDYLDLVADLDWKKRTAGTKKEKQKAAKTRRHTRNMFETQRRTDPDAKFRKSKQPMSLDAKTVLAKIQHQCMQAAIDQKRKMSGEHTDYDAGRQQGKLDAYDELYQVVSDLLKGD